MSVLKGECEQLNKCIFNQPGGVCVQVSNWERNGTNKQDKSLAATDLLTSQSMSRQVSDGANESDHGSRITSK